jgi:hypothetical protein
MFSSSAPSRLPRKPESVLIVVGGRIASVS